MRVVLILSYNSKSEWANFPKCLTIPKFELSLNVGILFPDWYMIQHCQPVKYNFILTFPKHTDSFDDNHRTGHSIYGKIIWARVCITVTPKICQNDVPDAFIISLRAGLHINSYFKQKANRCHSRERLKFIRKQLPSNHCLTLSPHCVLYLWKQYSDNDTYTFPLLICLLFVQPFVPCTPTCGGYETLWSNSLW